MEQDIVQRLRDYAVDVNCEDWCHHLLNEAADIIERLRNPERCGHGTLIKRKADGSSVWRFCCDYEP